MRQILDDGIDAGTHTLEEKLDPRGTFAARSDTKEPGRWIMYALDMSSANSRAILEIAQELDARGSQ